MVTVELANIENILEVEVWLVDNIITEPTLINVPLSLCWNEDANYVDHPGYLGFGS